MVLLDEVLNLADLQRGMEEKLINRRESGDGLSIYNYSDSAMYTPGAWDNPAVRICRGLIVEDRTQKVIARPWVKFFNHGQVESGELDPTAAVEVTDKLDGSLGIVYAFDGQVRVATRGSFESDQALWATEWINSHWPFHRTRGDILQLLKFTTLLVEIIYPENRIVCDYGNFQGLVLIGAVDIDSGKYLSPYDRLFHYVWKAKRTPAFPYRNLREALEATPREGAEGLCIRYLDEPKIVKFKQEDYIRLHRIVTGLSERSVWEHMMGGGSLEDLLAPLPDELHAWAKEAYEGISLEVDRIFERATDIYATVLQEVSPVDAPRKEYARHFKDYLPPFPSLLFMLYDGKDIRPAILKTLKPRGDLRAKTTSEDVA